MKLDMVSEQCGAVGWNVKWTESMKRVVYYVSGLSRQWVGYSQCVHNVVTIANGALCKCVVSLEVVFRGLERTVKVG